MKVCSVCRCPGVVGGFSGSTVSRVPVPKVSPALVTECVWMGRTGPECVSVTKVSTGPAVRRARTANMESTVTRVRSPRSPRVTPSENKRLLPVPLWCVSADCGCQNGRCNEGVTGDGTCECDVGWRGVLCDESMTTNISADSNETHFRRCHILRKLILRFFDW